MVNNLIQWPKAKYWTAQWNPVIGCKPCSPACENCYAAAWAKRFGQSFEPHKSSKRIPPRKGAIFCGNVTDLFGDWRTTEDMGNDIIHATIRGWDADATYLWLTKRVGNMCNALEWASKTIREHWFHNHYFGFTAENQEWYEKRLQLRAASAPMFPDWANLWVSCEPLLGPIDLGLIFCGELVKPAYKWVVVGCESGPNRRPCKIEWVESIVEQCMAASVPVFVKQLDIGGKCVTDINKFPAHLQIRQVPWAKEGGAKLREALVKCREIALQWQADEAAGVAGTTDKPHARSAAEAVVDMEFEINAALAAPPRNCDVGTAQEQIRRWNEDCNKDRIACSSFMDCSECALRWAQLSYEEGGDK